MLEKTNAYSKSTIETPHIGEKHVKLTMKDSRTMLLRLFWCVHC